MLGPHELNLKHVLNERLVELLREKEIKCYQILKEFIAANA